MLPFLCAINHLFVLFYILPKYATTVWGQEFPSYVPFYWPKLRSNIDKLHSMDLGHKILILESNWFVNVPVLMGFCSQQKGSAFPYITICDANRSSTPFVEPVVQTCFFLCTYSSHKVYALEAHTCSSRNLPAIHWCHHRSKTNFNMLSILNI